MKMEMSWRAAAAGRGHGSQLGVGNGERYGGGSERVGREEAGGWWCETVVFVDSQDASRDHLKALGVAMGAGGEGPRQPIAGSWMVIPAAPTQD